MGFAGIVLAGFVGLALGAVGATALRSIDRSQAGESASRGRMVSTPLLFVENEGQVDPNVALYARDGGFGLFLERREAILSFAGRPGVGLRFLGADPEPRIDGFEPRPTLVNHLVGQRRNWRAGLSTFGAARYHDLWPGIDMVLRGRGGRLEYLFVVEPGARPEHIRLAYRGADGLDVDGDGDLRVRTGAGILEDQRPVTYQEVKGARRPVESRYRLDGSEFGFIVDEGYDRRRPLVIDPTIDYSTYLGGGRLDNANDVATDGSLSAFVTGYTESPDLGATTGDSTLGGPNDAYIAKLNRSGSGFVYITYVGGGGAEAGTGITLDGDGNAYVTGYTSSTDFPTAGGGDASPNGGLDGFVLKLNSAGSAVVYSGYLGGAGNDSGNDIALDEDGNVDVVGQTSSPSLTGTAGSFDPTHNGGGPDGFLAELGPTGALVYFGFIGGAGRDAAVALDLDDDGNVYTVGLTESSDTLLAPNGFDTSFNGGFDAFVIRVLNDGTAENYGTLLGGGDMDYATDIDLLEVDGVPHVVVGGATLSTNFPTTANAYDPTDDGGQDGFIVRFSPQGGVIAATLIGGGASDEISSVTIDRSGVYGTATTGSANFPTTNDALDRQLGGPSDAAGVELDAQLRELEFGTFVGGGGAEFARGAAVDLLGAIYVAGETQSGNFPTTAGAPNRSLDGDSDGFLAKVSVSDLTEQIQKLAGGNLSSSQHLANASQSLRRGNRPAACYWLEGYRFIHPETAAAVAELISRIRCGANRRVSYTDTLTPRRRSARHIAPATKSKIEIVAASPRNGRLLDLNAYRIVRPAASQRTVASASAPGLKVRKRRTRSQVRATVTGLRPGSILSFRVVAKKLTRPIRVTTVARPR